MFFKWASPYHAPQGAKTISAVLKNFLGQILLDAEGILKKYLLLTKLLTFLQIGRGPATPLGVAKFFFCYFSRFCINIKLILSILENILILIKRIIYSID